MSTQRVDNPMFYFQQKKREKRNRIEKNPTDNVLRELKKSHCFKTEKRRTLTKPEQELFLNYLKNTPEAQYWYPIFAVMVGTGLRVGELTGLRWYDIDLEEGIIDVNHTLVYYEHRTEGSKMLFTTLNDASFFTLNGGVFA